MTKPNSFVSVPKIEAALPGAEPSEQEVRAVFYGLIIVLSLAAIDQSVVATALPRIVQELGGLNHLSWVVTAYVLASTSAMPLYGKLSDQYGRKPVLYGAILIFLIGSAFSGLARSLLALILFRALQDLGAGGLLPLAQTIIGDLVPPARRGRRQGQIVAVFAVCSVIGPLVGGVITELLSWHWIFYINLPVGAVAFIVIARALRRPHPTRARRIDYLGALLLTAGITGFLLVLTLGGTEWPWLSPEIGFAAGAALLCTALYTLHARNTPEPVLPPELFQSRLFGVAATVLALTFMGMLGASVFFPLFFQVVMGIRPSYSGFLTGPLMIGVVVSSIVNGRLLLRSGRYKPAQIMGLLIATASFAVLSWALATARSLFVIEPAMFAVGLGLGLVTPNMTIAVQNGLALAHRGVGTATLAFFRSLGGLVGVAGAGAIFSWQMQRLTQITETPRTGLRALTHTNLPMATHMLSKAPTALIAVYRHAIASIFTTGVGIMGMALILIFFLPELPLVADHAEDRFPSATSFGRGGSR